MQPNETPINYNIFKDNSEPIKIKCGISAITFWNKFCADITNGQNNYFELINQETYPLTIFMGLPKQSNVNINCDDIAEKIIELAYIHIAEFVGAVEFDPYICVYSVGEDDLYYYLKFVFPNFRNIEFKIKAIINKLKERVLAASIIKITTDTIFSYYDKFKDVERTGKTLSFL